MLRIISIIRTKMIDELKYLLDTYKDNPKMLKILSPLAAMSEKSQEASLKIIKLVISVA